METLEAYRCSNGHLLFPSHRVCPNCRTDLKEKVDLTGETGEVVTWTKNTVTPPGVEAPNLVAIVEFELNDDSVRLIGQMEGSGTPEIGTEVEPVYAEQLRTPGAGIREPRSQEWDGFRFRPV